MIGLEFIAKTFKKEYKQIAEAIGVSPATIQDWLKGRRRIPQKRLEQLSELFNISNDYFGRELTNLEKMNIQLNELKQNDIGHDISQTNIEENEVGATYWENEDIIHHLNFKVERLEAIEKLLKKIEVVMANEDINPFDFDETVSTNYDIFSKVTRILGNYNNDQKQVLSMIINLMSFNNNQFEEDISNAVFRYVPKGKEKLANDLMTVFVEHGLLKKETEED